MKSNLARSAFWTGLSILLVQQICSFLWGDSGPPPSAPYVSLLFPGVWVFFLLFHMLAIRLFQTNEARSSIYYLGLLGGKMLLTMMLVLIYGYFYPEGLRVFVSVLLPLYALLTAIQVTETLVYLRKRERSQE
ncbi:MAG: hypothetical protein ABEH38_00800 [Flavobacteriales bacterium]